MSQDLDPGVPGSQASDSYGAGRQQWLEALGTAETLKSIMTNHPDLPGTETVLGTLDFQCYEWESWEQTGMHWLLDFHRIKHQATRVCLGREEGRPVVRPSCSPLWPRLLCHRCAASVLFYAVTHPGALSKKFTFLPVMISSVPILNPQSAGIQLPE